MAGKSQQSRKTPTVSPAEGPQAALGDVCFDARTGEVQRGGTVVRLTPKAAAVLMTLVERAPGLVSKEELVTKVWNGKAIGDDAVTSCMQELRKALDDNARRPRYIETRHRRGYRLIGPLGGSRTTGGIDHRGATPLAAPPDKPSIAVLPFENMSGDPEQAYFADGLAEDLITGLSRVSWLFVIARNSSFAFRGQQIDARMIGELLGVRYLVEGSVRRSGQRLRLTAQLIEAATGNHLWAERYDGAFGDVFDFQDQTVVSLVSAIEPKLRATEIARARRKRPDSLDAFDLFLQALPKAAASSPQSLAEAIELLDRAIGLAPDYSSALSLAAGCRVGRPMMGYSPDIAKDFREAAELSRRALESDPTDPLVLAHAANVAATMHRDYQGGWDLIDRALAIAPNYAAAWGNRGWISAWAGATDDAIAEFEQALRLSPIDPQWGGRYKQGIAFTLCTSGRAEDALPWARKAVLDLPGSSATQRPMIAALWLSGRYAEAREAAKKYVNMFPQFSMRRYIETAPFRGTSGQQQFFDALRQAGLPE